MQKKKKKLFQMDSDGLIRCHWKKYCSTILLVSVVQINSEENPQGRNLKVHYIFSY